MRWSIIASKLILNKGKFIMKYLAWFLFLLVMISDANAYDVMNDIHEERMLSDDPYPINPWIVIGIIVLMYIMYGLYKKRIRMKDLFNFIIICFDVILITLIIIFGYIPSPLEIISCLYIVFVCVWRISNWNDYVKRHELDKD